jgi:hypothetical protein
MSRRIANQYEMWDCIAMILEESINNDPTPEMTIRDMVGYLEDGGLTRDLDFGDLMIPHRRGTALIHNNPQMQSQILRRYNLGEIVFPTTETRIKTRIRMEEDNIVEWASCLLI